MKVLVAQLGARRHYLVPVALHQAGLLERFCTDVYLKQGLARGLLKGLASVAPFRPLKRVAARMDSKLPEQLVQTFPMLGIEYRWRAAATRKKGELTKTWMWAGQAFGRQVVRSGFGDAQAVYAYSSAALEIFTAAKKQGLACILDHATAPRHLEMDLAKKEADRYPGWAQQERPDHWLNDYAQRQQAEAELADVIICGSTFVKNLVDEAWRLGEKCVVIPLGLRTQPLISEKSQLPKPRLNILFVGDEPIRKGLPELVAALKQLPPETYEARAIGHLGLSEFGQREATPVIQLVGAVPRDEMSRQYHWADVLVLPSTSDTFALVVLEAMAHGVPVIVSTNTGAADAVEDMESGMIIPPFDPDAIADRLRLLQADPGLRQRLSASAKNRMDRFTVDAYSRQLIATIQTVVN